MSAAPLPRAEKHRVQLGCVRLTDSAPLIVARELGLFDKYGMDVTLSREVTWANVRDKLAAGVLDGAQMLAPLPIMTTLGASGLRVPMLSGLTLSLNGNAVTLSAALWQELRVRCGSQASAPQAACALKQVIDSRDPSSRLTLAVVHSFSTHVILLRRWLRSGGIDPDHDVRTIVVPPAQMVDSLASGVIDGYCVGEPWNSLAVHYGLGAMAAIGAEVRPGAPEKVFCVTERWHGEHPGAHLRLRLALMEAGAWLHEPGNRSAAARLVAAPEYLDLPADRLLPSLTGRLRREPAGPESTVDDFHVFDPVVAGCPSRADAAFLLEQCGELLGRPIDAQRVIALAQQTVRPDLYRDAARHLGIATAPALSRTD